jgi:hypothetical protein
MKHELWLWLWFTIGMATFWLKRAYFGINPPNPIATSYTHWLQRSWAPLLVRAFIDGTAFWLLFTPGVTDKALAYFGWENYSWGVSMITQFAPVAAMFGYVVDSVVDFSVTKIPFVKDIVPQMPGPLPQTAVVQAQLVTQTTEVTQLQSKTTTLNPEGK